MEDTKLIVELVLLYIFSGFINGLIIGYLSGILMERSEKKCMKKWKDE